MIKIHSITAITQKTTYVSSKIFKENLVAVHKIKETLTLNRPAYVGMCILDLSKTLMYKFHYDYIKYCLINKQECFIGFKTTRRSRVALDPIKHDLRVY